MDGSRLRKQCRFLEFNSERHSLKKQVVHKQPVFLMFRTMSSVVFCLFKKNMNNELKKKLLENSSSLSKTIKNFLHIRSGI